MNGLLQSPDEEVRRAAVASLGHGPDELALLVLALGDASWRVRKEAVGRAAAWPDRERASALLVETLAEPENVGRRNAAVEALARIGAHAVPELSAALSARPEHRKLIVDTLGLIGDRAGAAALVPSLDDADPNVRAAAAEALGRIGGRDAEAALLGALEHGDLLVSLACLSALNRLGAALPARRIAHLLETPVLRPSVLVALGNSRDPAAAPLLSRSLTDPSRAVREGAAQAIDALRSVLDGEARAELARSLRDLPAEARRSLAAATAEGSPPVRRAALVALGLSGDAGSVPSICAALRDPSLEQAAGEALIDLGSAALPALATILGTADAETRLAILRILPSLPAGGDATILAALQAALGDEDDEVAGQAAHGLGLLGGGAVIPALFAALARDAIAPSVEAALRSLAFRFPLEARAAILARGFEGDDGRHLCRVLSACAQRDDARTFEGLLAAAAPPLRASAVEALAGLVGDRAAPRLIECLGDPAPAVRAAAARAVAPFQIGRAALVARQFAEEDPLVRAIIAASLALPPGA